MAEFADLLRTACDQIDRYIEQFYGSVVSGTYDDIRLGPGHATYDAVRLLLDNVTDAKPDSTQSNNFPGEGGRRWYAVLRESRGHQRDEELIDRSERLRDWLLSHYGGQKIPEGSSPQRSLNQRLIGSAQHLIKLLQQHFLPTGSPPEMPAWMYSVPRKPEDGYRPKSNQFRDFLTDTLEDPVLEEALQEISPLKEVAESLQSVSSAIENNNDAHHLSFLFEKLLSLPWREFICQTSTGNADGSEDDHLFGYKFKEIDKDSINDLRDACDNLVCEQSVQLKSDTDNQTTFKEQCILDAIKGDALTGPQIAKKTGFTYNSHLRVSLSGMVKRKLLKKTINGYRVT